MPVPQDVTTALESNPEEETSWLRAVANGDRGCFRKIHDRFERLLYANIHKVLNNPQDSEDVLQEVFAQIWAKAHLYDPAKGRPMTWMMTMARNRAIDRYRSKQRRSLLGERFRDHRDTIGVGAASREVTSREIEQNDTRELLQSAVYELTPEQRESIEMTYFGGLTQREVAEQIGQEVGTVKARIRRGIKRMEKSVRAELG